MSKLEVYESNEPYKTVVNPADQPPSTLPNLLERVISDPAFDLERVQRVIDMHEAMEAKQLRSAYVDALARAQAAFPDIDKLGKSHHGHYGRWEDIHKAITPALASNGIALSFSVNTDDPKRIGVMAIARHRSGHEERGDWVWLPIDTSGNKNPAQQVGSTMSYGKRYAAGFLLNFRVGGEDTDANPPKALSGEKLTAKQLETLRSAIEFMDGNESALMKWANASGIAGNDLEEVDGSHFDRLKTQLAYWAEKRASASEAGND